MSSTRLPVLSTYRRLLRSVGTVFGRDVVAKTGAYAVAREQMNQNLALGDEAQILKLVDEMEDARQFVLTQVVQAELKDDSKRVVLQPKQRHSTLSLIHISEPTRPY
eukprot:TRINITY_DN13773_c0_g1_i2.p1 TRINITY_DN13773_c0_g1~~TRINITY_DN13773_c0_g1_i2.p1  ORF type:complete len:107 (-),score=35.55 TRINITY_DN13773_c0_g1_i2:77-397(-)